MRRINTYAIKWIKLLCAIALSLCLLLSTGCEKEPVEQTPESEPIVLCSVDDIRQAMDGTSQTFAAAYFGYTYKDNLQQLFEHIKSRAPMMCQTMPFILEIPQKNVVGEYHGEVYCIVPTDPAASVTVNRAVIDENGLPEYTETLFSSENGAPILLACNDSGFDPDTQVIITDSNGTETFWYPKLNDYHFIDPLWSEAGDDLLWDFTSYSEALAADYANMQKEGWSLPEKEDLVGKAWGHEITLSDGRRETCLISFDKNAAYVRWNEGVGEEDHEYIEAEWVLSRKNGFAVLSIDFGEFAGILRYNLLYNKEYRQLFTMMDASTDSVEPGYECLYRYLEPRSMDVPDPVEMVGTWKRFQWETDGYREDDTSGTHTIVITGETQTDLTISFTNKESQNFNYKNKPLDVMQGVLYPDCGNNLWLAKVDHVGPWDTTCTVTLLEDGTLLLQSYWEMDGSPMVSYEWFRLV